MIQKQFFRVFQLFAPEVKYFHQKYTWKKQQKPPWAFQPTVWGISCLVLLPSPCNDSACTYHSAIFVKPQQWPTPSESIAIYCVRKLVSCITHLQSCAKVDIWNKKKKLRTVAKIKPQGYKNWRLPKFSTSVTLPLSTATTLFNEPRSQRPFGTSDWQNYSSRLAWLSSQAKYTKLVSLRNKLR